MEVGIFTELARGPQSLQEVSQRLGLHPRSAQDFLDALVALGFLGKEGDRYTNTPQTGLFQLAAVPREHGDTGGTTPLSGV